MRHIGNLTDETQARAFGDVLLAKGIRNEVESDSDGSWLIWVVDEDHVADASQLLTRFRSNPTDPEFAQASAQAARVREAEAEELIAYRRRVRTRRSLFPSFGGYGVGVLTYAMIFACCVVAVYSKLGKNHEFLQGWLISETGLDWQQFLPEVSSGEIWRLVTPVFVHFGIIHLLFNMMWLFQLGCMIEARLSSLYLAGLVVVTGALSNFAQYYVTHTNSPSPFDSNFGGMSGVVYALAGFVWMRGKYHPGSGVFLDSRSVTILLIWLVICYTGFVGSIANTAHLVGLISGLIWGRVSAYFASQRPE